MEALREWEAFYLIVGTAAAALTGLQFVVVVLGAEMNMLRPGSTRAFATPTIVHFSAVLLISSFLTIPWHALRALHACLVVGGMVGLLYTVLVIRHTRRQTHYKPVFEDWVWHAILPIAAYALLLTAAMLLVRNEAAALFMAGSSSLALLFTGIHNAWDAVMYVALTGAAEKQSPGDKS